MLVTLHSFVESFLKTLVISFIEEVMFSTGKNRQQNASFLDQLGGPDIEFKDRQGHQAIQIECRQNITDENLNSNNANHWASVKASQVDVLSFRRSISGRAHCEMDSLKATAGNKLHDAILTAIESLVNPIVERAMKLVNVSSGSAIDRVELGPDKGDFP